jgi:hypothetical protein
MALVFLIALAALRGERNFAAHRLERFLRRGDPPRSFQIYFGTASG